MPDQIQFTEGHKNMYTYDASGNKLEAVNYTVHNIINVPINTISTLPSNPSDYTKLTTDYVGNMIYENGSLKQILLPEGYYQGGVYYYYLKDHLGNNRVVINSSGAIMEKNHYYPTGMRFYPESTSNSAALPYRYNGKELEAMNGLNQYDYGARRRGAGLPLWTAVDPLAENHLNVSPYAYCLNNSINYIDPLGLDTVSSGSLENKWHNFNINKDVVSLNEVTVTPNSTSSGVDYSMFLLYANGQGAKNAKVGIDYFSAIGSTYAGYRYTERMWGNGYFRTSKGYLHSLSELKPQVSGKFVKGVQGIRIGANAARYSVRTLTRTVNVIGGLSTAYSMYQFKQDPTFENGFDVTTGVASYLWWEVGVYSAAASVMVLSTTGERQQIQQNVMNNENPLNDVYVPGVGTTYVSPF